VAHALAKDLKNGHLPERQSYDVSVMKNDGTDDLFDRDEVHEIYATWREVFNEYDPPRMAVAEAMVHANRRPAYASTKGLGQSFNFDMLGAGWNPKRVREIADESLTASKKTGSSTTWVLSNHDVIRHATRFALPKVDNFFTWYKDNRFNPGLDEKLGLDRARAMIMLLLALPGSTYIYQGEELGLQEALEIPADQMQDPQFFRNPELGISRDGCRVPLPWTSTGSSFGFGSGGSHLPQPAWYGSVSVATQDGVQGSTLELYRELIKLRKSLQTTEEVAWVRHWLSPQLVHFKRPNGWHNLTNFGTKPAKLPAGRVLAVSQPLVDGKLPANATVWLNF
jgi:alpha-glucosidase